MKKAMLLLGILLVIPFSVKAEDLTYEEAQGAVKQSIQAWYMRGSYRQYNSSKNSYSILRHPEDATAQDTGYSVCSGFTNDVWMEAFGFKSTNDGIGGHTPAGSESYCLEARQYLDNKGCTTSNPNKTGCKGEYLVYYYNKQDSKEYIYNPNRLARDKLITVKNFVNNLQVGDIVSFNGHAVVVYDFKYDSNGNKIDALLFQSIGNRSLKVFTKIDPDANGLHQLFYYKVYNKEKNGLLDLNSDTFMRFEGTTHWKWFSSYTYFVKNGKLNCKRDMCSITRSFYKGSNGKAVLNYDTEWPQQIGTSKARLEMPGIFIQKTSSKYDNNSVVLGNSITYTIRIVNNSNLVRVKGKIQSKKYKSFYVEETLPNEVDFVSSSVNDSLKGSYDKSKRTIKWKISSLAAGKTIIIKYKVKVKKDVNNLNHFFEANGKVYSNNANHYIPTGTVKHEIINNTSTVDADYLNCYNKVKKNGATSLTLIQKTYECVYGDDLNVSFMKFSSSGGNMLDRLIVRPYKNPSKGKFGAIRLNNTGENKLYADMILNNYWNGIVKTNYEKENSNDYYYMLPRWRQLSSGNYIGEINRAKTIESGHFRTGDVLIYYVDNDSTKSELRYTKENGLYAFIYINGSFVGVNYNGKTNQRNTFTKDYYTERGLDLAKNLYSGSSSYYDFANYQTLMGKDSYVILRPEKVITEVSKISVKTKPKKTTYFQTQAIDVAGGVITATKTDGSTENINMTASGVSIGGYDSKTLGNQNVSVTYKGKSTSFQVVVNEKQVTSIKVLHAPTKTRYFVGESLDLSGGVIEALFSDNSLVIYSMSNSGISISGFDSSTPGTKKITVTYKGKTTTFNVDVVAVEYTSLKIKRYPNKLVYTIGEPLDLTGGILQKNYNNETMQTAAMTDSSVQVSGYNSANAGIQTITLTKDGKSTSFEVVVNKSSPIEENLILNSISIYKKPTKISYNIGESLDLTNGYILVNYSKTGETTSLASSDVVEMSQKDITITGFSSTTEGEKNVTVSYKGKSATFTVAVSGIKPELKEIKISKNPVKTKYIQYQDDLNATLGELTAIYTDGSTEIIKLTDSNVSLLDFDNAILGEQEVRVIYKGMETSFVVTVYQSEEAAEEEDDEGPIVKVELSHQPDKTTYIQGLENLDVTGIILRVQYEDGSVRSFDLYDCPGLYTISGYDNMKVGEQNVIINYQGYEVSFKVMVLRNGIEITSPDTFVKRSILAIIISISFILSGMLFMIKKRNNNS